MKQIFLLLFLFPALLIAACNDQRLISLHPPNTDPIPASEGEGEQAGEGEQNVGEGEGDAIHGCQLSVEPASIDFKELTTYRTHGRMLFVSNKGDANCLYTAHLTGAELGFYVDDEDQQKVLEPGSGYSSNMFFDWEGSVQTSGPVSAQIDFNNGGTSLASVALTGEFPNESFVEVWPDQIFLGCNTSDPLGPTSLDAWVSLGGSYNPLELTGINAGTDVVTSGISFPAQLNDRHSLLTMHVTRNNFGAAVNTSLSMVTNAGDFNVPVYLAPCPAASPVPPTSSSTLHIPAGSSLELSIYSSAEVFIDGTQVASPGNRISIPLPSSVGPHLLGLHVAAQVPVAGQSLELAINSGSIQVFASGDPRLLAFLIKAEGGQASPISAGFAQTWVDDSGWGPAVICDEPVWFGFPPELGLIAANQLMPNVPMVSSDGGCWGGEDDYYRLTFIVDP